MLSVKYLHITKMWLVGGKLAKFKKRLVRVGFKKRWISTNGMDICTRRYLQAELQEYCTKTDGAASSGHGLERM